MRCVPYSTEFVRSWDEYFSKSVHFDDRYLHVELEDGRIILTLMSWYKQLQAATFKQLSNYQFIFQDNGIEWSELDYHLNIESMLLSKINQKAA